MAITLYRNTNFVAHDGSVGFGDVILFDDTDLTDEQLLMLDNLGGSSDSICLLEAIMAGEPLDKWEN
jgi:hypothetical protein